MNSSDIKEILEKVSAGKISANDAYKSLKDFPFSNIDVAKHDAHRPLRNGFSEVIYCQGKHIDHIVKIVSHIDDKGHNVFGTRADEKTLSVITKKFPKAQCDEIGKTFKIVNRPIKALPGRISILCAGTADLFVAEEARQTALFFGFEPACHYDVGVAGLHRLISTLPEIEGSDCVIVVAGMEGALPSVVGGLIKAPIIAVPTSIGYGSSFGGIAALLSMLNSCSEGITVVNIDNGFGAACAALRILR